MDKSYIGLGDGMQSEPNLTCLIEFKDTSGHPLRKVFYEPDCVITATQPSEVIPALKSVEAHVANGLYAVGYVAYECAPAFDPALQVRSGLQMPLLWFGLYSTHDDLGMMAQTSKLSQHFQVGPWEPEVAQSEYEAKIDSILHAIAEGDTYQVNYTIRLKSQFAGSEMAFYEQLKNSQGSSYSAFLNIGRYKILSVSPELFFCKNHGHITAKPMKGTAPRGRWTSEDMGNKQWLHDSEKNRAENLMIVDLLRNDLGKISKLGSVKVPNLFEVESYRTVHQMTSTIVSEARSGVSLADVFRALFPCGSITGAPKSSTMRLISELETSPRGVYCGAIGIVSPEGQAIFSVAIRTVVIDSETGTALYGAGGGITWDSLAASEYEEVLAKSKVLSSAFPKIGLIETMRLEDGKYYLLERHLKRLAQSCKYFSINLDKQHVVDTLEACRLQHAIGVHKVRLVIRENCQVTVTATPLDGPSGQGRSDKGRDGSLHDYRSPDARGSCRDGMPVVKLADGPISSGDIFLYHKTTNRSCYVKHANPDVYDVILWNERDELTEFTKGNLVVLMDGLMMTPLLNSGLLAGTLRGELLETGKIREGVIRISDIPRFQKLWFINSVRGLVEVKLVDWNCRHGA